MFFINAPISNWEIVEKGESSFVIQNSKYQNVRLKVFDLKYTENLKFPEVNEEATNTIFTDDVFPSQLIVKHDQRTMIPCAYCIGDRKSRESVLAAVSITVPKGFKITSIYNGNVRLYAKHLDPQSHFDFIGNFIPDRETGNYPRISITTVNFGSRMVITYTVNFNRKTSKVHINTKRYNFEDIPPKGEKGYISIEDFVQGTVDKGYTYDEIPPVYFPNALMSTILVNSDSTEEFDTMLREKGSRWQNNKYEVITNVNVENGGIETLKSLYDKGYRAVTVFLNEELFIDIVRDSSWEEKFGKEISEVILNNFDTVNIVGSNGLVYKIKVYGKKSH